MAPNEPEESRNCFSFRSGSDEPIIRNGRTINPNQTEPSLGMDDTDHALFPRFSAELLTTALKDTPVVMVTAPRQCGKTTTTQFWPRHAAIPLG
jgi:hypothetical protein